MIGQIGLVETGSGLAHGPALLLIALGLTALMVPVRRLVRFILDR